MSLNWDSRKCGPEWAKLTDDTKTALIFNTMIVGIGAVTDDNLAELMRTHRAALVEKR